MRNGAPGPFDTGIRPEVGQEIREPLSGLEVAELDAGLYEAVSPRLGSLLVESSIVLAMAGMKGNGESAARTGVAEGEKDDAFAEDIVRANEYFQRTAPFLRFSGNRKASRHPQGFCYLGFGVTNLSGFERISRRTKLLSLSPFDASSGFDGLWEWREQVEVALEHAQRDGVIPPEHLLNIYRDGIELGYPDQAIKDFADWYVTGRKKRLMESQISGVGTYREHEPDFDFYPEHANDPEIRACIERSERILKEFYESDWHQRIQRDPGFIAAREQKERK